MTLEELLGLVGQTYVALALQPEPSLNLSDMTEEELDAFFDKL